jgi:hypothetical protein
MLYRRGQCDGRSSKRTDANNNDVIYIKELPRHGEAWQIISRQQEKVNPIPREIGSPFFIYSIYSI